MRTILVTGETRFTGSINGAANKLGHPLVSVCIPMYNVELYIEETITRLKQQTYPNIEIVIVDDHSTDKSYLLARQFVSERIHLSNDYIHR